MQAAGRITATGASPSQQSFRTVVQVAVVGRKRQRQWHLVSSLQPSSLLSSWSSLSSPPLSCRPASSALHRRRYSSLLYSHPVLKVHGPAAFLQSLVFFSTGNKRDHVKKTEDAARRQTAAKEPKDPTHSQRTPPTVWEQVRSLPNIITLTRMASTPLLCYWIVQGDYHWAMYGCCAAALSDGLDGYVAKHHGGATTLGTYLDPLADKALVNGLGLSLWYAGILPTPLVVVWAAKDLILLGGTGWYLYQEQRTVNFFSNSVATKPLMVTPTTLGKANTVLQFATLALGIVSPVAGPDVLPLIVLQSLCWVSGFTTVGSVFSYMGKSGIKTTMSSGNSKSR